LDFSCFRKIEKSLQKFLKYEKSMQYHYFSVTIQSKLLSKPMARFSSTLNVAVLPVSRSQHNGCAAMPDLATGGPAGKAKFRYLSLFRSCWMSRRAAATWRKSRFADRAEWLRSAMRGKDPMVARFGCHG